METTFSESLLKFNALIDEIEKGHEPIVIEAENLALKVGDATRTDLQGWWDRLWDKPLYTWINTGTSRIWRTHCEPYFGIEGAWRHIKRDSGGFRIEKVKSKEQAFVPYGETIRELHAHGVPLKRLYSMVGAAETLVAWEKVGKFPIRTSSELNAEIVAEIQATLGHGWGHVTVLHFLTDLGLACKPDMHLNASCHYLGMTIRKTKNPSLKEAIAIVDFVKRLVESRWGYVSPEKLRYTDKCLMEASVRDLLPVDPWYNQHHDWLKVSIQSDLSESVVCRWEADGVTVRTSNPKSYKKMLQRDVIRILGIESRKSEQTPRSPKTEIYENLASKKMEGKMLSFFVERKNGVKKGRNSGSSGAVE